MVSHVCFELLHTSVECVLFMAHKNDQSIKASCIEIQLTFMRTYVGGWLFDGKLTGWTIVRLAAWCTFYGTIELIAHQLNVIEQGKPVRMLSKLDSRRNIPTRRYTRL